ncbi:MAG: amidase [Gammaproteobacteria bacterium]|nr:amidase [Gammaproteobacteria bacterium]
MSTAIHTLTVRELSESLARRELTSVQITTALLERIDALDPTLHAFVHVTRERALAEAQAADLALAGGRTCGPLHGVPYAVKDLYDVHDLPTAAGCSLLNQSRAERDCHAVRSLSRAGMVLLGKTHTVQFAFGGVGINHDTGTPHNPWQQVPHAPGGSSSGTGVAVASGMAPMALGSDTGGSVRIPASLCGISGLKTTVGRISRAGVYPLSWTLDTVGPLARTIDDCALVYEALQGADPDGDDTTSGQLPHDLMSTLGDGVRGLRLAIPETLFWEDVEADVVEKVREAIEVLRSLGANVFEVPFDLINDLRGAERERLRAMTIAAEAYTINRQLAENHLDKLDPAVAQRLMTGNQISGPDYAATVRSWQDMRKQALHEMRDIDALLVPSTMATAKPIGDIDVDLDSYGVWNAKYLRNTSIGNILNLCGVSVPCGFDHAGSPVGLMVYAKPFDEGMATRVAHAYQNETKWHTRQPDLGWVG